MTPSALRLELARRQRESARVELARRDRNIFVEYVLGLKQGAIHREMQALWDTTPNSYAEVPRGHGKTLQSAAAVAFDIGKDPDIRVKYVQQNDDEAAKTCGLIRDILEREEYRRVFPHIHPGANWGKTAFTVERRATMRDPTLEACSIFGRAGGRFDLLVGDDVCDLRNSIQQPSYREQVKTAWANTWAPMADIASGKIVRTRAVGTPWHVDDLTADWRKYHEPRGTLLRRPVIGFDSPWPEVVTPEYLRAWKEEHLSVAYARAYLLTPLSDADTPIKAHWIKYLAPYELEPKSYYKFLGVDMAFKKGRENDFTVACEVGKDMQGRMIMTRFLRMKDDFPTVKKELKRFIGDQKYYGIQIDAHGQQEELARQLVEWTNAPITYDTRPEAKPARAARLALPIERGDFYMIGNGGVVDAGQRIVYDEITQFPVAAHDDCLDALASSVELADAFAFGGGEYVYLHEHVEEEDSLWG